MISRIGFFVIALLMLPAGAFASVVNIEFTAQITSTSGDGMGYQIGDLVSGTFVVDTAKADGKVLDTATSAWNYYGLDSSGVLQSSFAGAPLSLTDYVSVENANPQDSLTLAKVLSVQGSLLDSLHAQFRFGNLDWITNLSLDNINLSFNNAADLAGSSGSFARFDMNLWNVTDSAIFSFESVKIVSSAVPEPMPLLLLAIGLLALGLRRRI